MKLNEIFFELTTLRFVPRCTLLLSVVGAYNSGYEVRPLGSGLTQIAPYGRNFSYPQTLYEMPKYFCYFFALLLVKKSPLISP